MNDIQPLRPGKLKRKSKRNVSASVVDLPAVDGAAVNGNLLGDNIIHDFPQLAEDVDEAPFSLFGTTQVAQTVSEQATTPQSGVTLKENPEPEPVSSSPLDALNAEKLPDSVGAKSNDMGLTEHAGQKLASKSELSVPSQISRIPVKKKSSKTTVASGEKSEDYVAQLEALLEQNRDTQQKCLDTLAKLQNTNIQNERRYTLNLIIAFTFLAILTVVGVFAVTHFNTEARNNEVKFKNEEYKNAVKARDILEGEFDREKRGSAAAFEVYQRIEQGLFEESVEKFVEVRDQLTHPAEIALLEQRIDEIQWKLAENAYHDGVMLFNGSNFEQARDAFFKSLSYKENTAYSPRLNYYLAMSLFELGDFEGARRYFSQINSADLSSEMDAQARFHRALAAEKLGDEAEAYEQFDQFLRKYRYHRLSSEAAKYRAKVEAGRR